jgi:alpha-mannosidase
LKTVKKNCKVLVIPTTHWDRAWYWPFERFRVKLVEMWSAVKLMWEKHPDYKFSADGQLLCVEDYLEIFPEDIELFRKMGKDGRLRVGPLYCQSDLYCAGGEALIRNLLTGMEIADDLNARQNALYMPDSFGHIPCIPMICNGFGIDTYIFMRGVNDDIDTESRFWFWESPDGSRVQIFRLRDGYANAARLGLHGGTGEIMDKESSRIKPKFKMELAVEQIRGAAEKQADKMGEPFVLIAGVDHQIPQRELPDIMKNAETNQYTFRYSAWDEAAEIMRKKDRASWKVYCGELHGNGGSASILGGTVSSRIYLKQKNAECERLLLTAEAADAVAALIGVSDPAGRILKNTWKRLLKCQLHDNITGCSVDSVHREDSANFAKAEQSADAVIRKMAAKILEIYGGQKDGDRRYAFFLFNAQNAVLKKNLTLKIEHEGRLNWGDMPVHDFYDIVDESGKPLPFREISRSRSTEHPHPVVVLEIYAELQPFSINRFFFEAKDRWNKTEIGDLLENEFLQIKVKSNGGIDMLDKTNGVRYPDICLFSDQADCGDEYDFSHIANDREIIFNDVKFLRTSQNGYSGMQAAELSAKLRISQSSAPDGRSANFAELPVTLTYTLCPGQRCLDVRVSFANFANDHRLRLNMSLPFLPEKSFAGLKFNEVSRPCTDSFAQKKGGKEYIIDPIHPADHYMAVKNPADDSGFAIFAEFPFNYEIVKSKNSRLAITILRAVGILSRESLTRPGGAGPETLTPDAQCYGRRFEMRFGIRPFVSNEYERIFREAMLWRFQPVFGLIAGFDPPFNAGATEKLFEIGNPELIVSSFKQTDRRDGALILRLFNPTPKEQTFAVKSPLVKSYTPAGLDENPLSKKSERKIIRGKINKFGLYSAMMIPRQKQ